MRIYLTHCSKEKSAAAKANGLPLPPDELYTEDGIQQFMTACKQSGIEWAILSDKYGVFFPTERHPHYEKPPATVTAAEEQAIIMQFADKLAGFDEIWFYIRPETFHPFYERLLMGSSLHERITLFKDLNEIRG